MIKKKNLFYTPIRSLKVFYLILYFIRVSNQLPSTLTNKNVYSIIILSIGILCSMFLRYKPDIDLSLLSPLGGILIILCVFLSIFHFINVQINLVQRIYSIVKLGPTFLDLLEEDRKLPKKDRKHLLGIIVTYYLKTFSFVLLYLYVITRMVLSVNSYLGIIYAFSLLL